LDIKQIVDGAQEVFGLVEAPIYTKDGVCVWEKLKAGGRAVPQHQARE
jgi:kinesin family protein C2/C3